MSISQTQGFFDIDGVRLEYRWFGPWPEAAPTLVFLHEGLGCVALWKDFPERVAEATDCRVLVYSRQGYGRSDPIPVPRPLTYMHEEGLSILPKVLDAAGLKEVILVGHSDGGSIALIHAGGVRDPRVQALALMAPHVFNEELCVGSIRLAKEAYEQGRLRQQLARYHGDNVDCAFWGWNRAWLDPGFWHWNIEEYLPGIAVPVLLIQGENDEYGTLRQVEAIRDRVSGPVEILMLPNCGHSPHRDQPEATLEAITRFVGQRRGVSRASLASE
ncbi:MAG TPA: alpha/beta hydrolase [Candidatus Competibacteraceae bacterium]|nr:alpha/beta hydrolase [Candidatus Competibacteraceae bacterium]